MHSAEDADPKSRYGGLSTKLGRTQQEDSRKSGFPPERTAEGGVRRWKRAVEETEIRVVRVEVRGKLIPMEQKMTMEFYTAKSLFYIKILNTK